MLLLTTLKPALLTAKCAISSANIIINNLFHLHEILSLCILITVMYVWNSTLAHCLMMTIMYRRLVFIMFTVCLYIVVLGFELLELVVQVNRGGLDVYCIC